jgi:hypothetical protein
MASKMTVMRAVMCMSTLLRTSLILKTGITLNSFWLSTGSKNYAVRETRTSAARQIQTGAQGTQTVDKRISRSAATNRVMIVRKILPITAKHEARWIKKNAGSQVPALIRFCVN